MQRDSTAFFNRSTVHVRHGALCDGHEIRDGVVAQDNPISNDAAAGPGIRPHRCSRSLGRSAPNRDRQGVQGRGRADVLATRSAASADQLAAPAEALVAEIARFVGQRKLSVTADTYTHVLSDGAEVGYRVLASSYWCPFVAGVGFKGPYN
jgi:hypothetical protein